MKKAVLFLIASMSLNAMAELVEIRNIKCFADRYGDKISIQIDKLEYDNTSLEGRITSFEMSHVVETNPHDVMPFYEVMSFKDKEVESMDYDPDKYVGHMKFNLLAGGNGYHVAENMNLIISPEYETISDEVECNHWNKNRCWTKEVREYSAVLDLNFNDHHGDYVPLQCISLHSELISQ